jgi:hypothetical protein
MKKYRVMTEVSSFEDGRPLLYETGNIKDARRECREWAEWDDVFVWVEDEDGDIVYSRDGVAA